MDYTEKTLKKHYVYQGQILNLRADEVILSNNATAKREIVEHSGGACILYVEKGKILFVRQYRYAYGENVLELPAGKLDLNENPKNTALRELEEETGIKASDCQLLYQVYPSPGYTNEKIFIYQAKNGIKSEQRLDEEEFLDVVWIEEDKVKEMLTSGQIKDGKTIIALQHYFLNKKA